MKKSLVFVAAAVLFASHAFAAAYWVVMKDGSRYVIGTITDITERITAAQEVERSGRFMEAVLNAVPSPIIATCHGFERSRPEEVSGFVVTLNRVHAGAKLIAPAPSTARVSRPSEASMLRCASDSPKAWRGLA